MREVFPGNILADRVTTPSGMVLLPAGVKLTKEHLDKMKRFGVHAVMVK